MNYVRRVLGLAAVSSLGLLATPVFGDGENSGVISPELSGRWWGYAVSGAGDGYQHVFTMTPAGADWRADALFSCAMSTEQVARAERGEEQTGALLTDAHAFRELFDVTSTGGVLTFQGSAPELFCDHRDDKKNLGPAHFVVSLQAPGILVGTWEDPSFSDVGYFFARAEWATSPPPLELALGDFHELGCAGAPALQYRLYLPRSYDPRHPAPVLLNIPPGGPGQPLSETMAEELGWIMAGVNMPGNDWRTILSGSAGTLFDLQRRLNIDPRRIYFCGFSAGARMASESARMFPDATAGIFCMGAGFGQWMEGPRYAQYRAPLPHIPAFFLVGESDMNYDEVAVTVYQKEKKRRVVELLVHPGGHDEGRPEDRDAAIRWLDAQWKSSAQQ